MDLLGRYRKSERIGRMDQQITGQYFTEAVNTYGERVEAWVFDAVMWAQVEYNILRSKEGEEAGQEQAKQVVMFTIRTRDIDEKDRIFYDNRYYDIETVVKSNDRQYMTLVCRQIDQ